jgi:hypothetical protein
MNKSKGLAMLLALPLIAFSLVACSEKSFSVEYYVQNKAERVAQLELCNKEMKQVVENSNCYNATLADQQVTLQSVPKDGKSVSESFKFKPEERK